MPPKWGDIVDDELGSGGSVNSRTLSADLREVRSARSPPSLNREDTITDASVLPQAMRLGRMDSRGSGTAVPSPLGAGAAAAGGHMRLLQRGMPTEAEVRAAAAAQASGTSPAQDMHPEGWDNRRRWENDRTPG